MELLNTLLTNIGVDIQLILTLAGAVLLIVNMIKDKIALTGYQITGKLTQAITIIVSFGFSYLVFKHAPGELNWIGIAFTTFTSWMGPDSLNTYINRKVSKISG